MAPAREFGKARVLTHAFFQCDRNIEDPRVS